MDKFKLNKNQEILAAKGKRQRDARCKNGYERLDYEVIENHMGTMGPYGYMIYTLLLKYNNDELGYAFPSQDKIIEITRLSKSTVVRTIKRLADMGYIEIVHGFKKRNPDGTITQESNKYIILELPKSTQESNVIPMIAKVAEESKAVAGDNTLSEEDAQQIAESVESIDRLAKDDRAKLLPIMNEIVIKQGFSRSAMDMVVQCFQDVQWETVNAKFIENAYKEHIKYEKAPDIPQPEYPLYEYVEEMAPF